MKHLAFPFTRRWIRVGCRISLGLSATKTGPIKFSTYSYVVVPHNSPTVTVLGIGALE